MNQSVCLGELRSQLTETCEEHQVKTTEKNNSDSCLALFERQVYRYMNEFFILRDDHL